MLNKTPEEMKAIREKGIATRKRNKENRDAVRLNAIIYRDGLLDQIAELEAKLENLKTVNALQAASIALTGKALLRENQIAARATPWQQSSGVYFLLKKSRVIYCGQAINIYARIPQHKDKDFDSYSYVPAPIETLDLLESLYIHVLQPERNGQQCNGAMQAPIALDSLLKTLRPKAEKQRANHAHPD